MAAALLERKAGDHVLVRSAGSAPADTINPIVVEVMAEIGIDLDARNAHPKRMEDSVIRSSDIVVTMGCGDSCTYYPGKRYEDWQIDDPTGKDIAKVREIRDEIEKKVDELIASLEIAM